MTLGQTLLQPSLLMLPLVAFVPTAEESSNADSAINANSLYPIESQYAICHDRQPLHYWRGFEDHPSMSAMRRSQARPSDPLRAITIEELLFFGSLALFALEYINRH